MPMSSPTAPIGSSHRMLNQRLPMRISGTRALTGGMRRALSATTTRSAAEDSSVSSGSGVLSGSGADARRGAPPLPSGLFSLDRFITRSPFTRILVSCRALLPGGRKSRLDDACALVELAVEGDGGVDKRKVGECLREIAELPAGGIDFF